MCLVCLIIQHPPFPMYSLIYDSPSNHTFPTISRQQPPPQQQQQRQLACFSRQTGGPLDHTSFSLQLPQAAVQLPPSMLLDRYKDNRGAFGTLPTGTNPPSSYHFLPPEL